MKISIVCPFFNEEDIIESSSRRMLANLDSQFSEWELILVNDGSQDGSVANLLAALPPDEKRVRVLSCLVNQGRGRALKNGIDMATGDVVVTTEVDCSWGDDIPKRLVNELLEKNLDVVIASPHMDGGGLVNVPLKRVLITRVGNLLINSLFSSGVTMSTGMTRAYRREVIQPLVAIENGKEFHLEVLLKLRTLGFRIGEIPAVLEWQDHKLSKSGNVNVRKSSTRLVKTMGTHLRFLAVAQPRTHFAWLAAFTALGGTGFMGWALLNFALGTPAIFLAIIGLQLFLFALIFGGFSVLFVESRDILREHWLKYYPSPLPPSAVPAREVERAYAAVSGVVD
ncbi:MAG: glycosyltransferase family 2 protein [Sulfuritalea sp.]|nr:glycosyltransferase family 2 protein [Sulfuritalea sp.]